MHVLSMINKYVSSKLIIFTSQENEKLRRNNIFDKIKLEFNAFMVLIKLVISWKRKKKCLPSNREIRKKREQCND